MHASSKSKHSSAQEKFEALELAYSKRESQVEENIRLLKNYDHQADSIIGKQWFFVCTLTTISYIAVQLLISYSQSGICRESAKFSNETIYFGVAFLSMYSLATCYYVFSAIYVRSWSEKEVAHLRGIYSCSATISFVTGAATGLYIVPGVGNYACIDALGVYSPNPQWAEWLVLSPLLAYMAIAVEEKPANLTWTDLIAIFRFGLCIFFGFLMTFPLNIIAGWVLFSLAFISMAGNVVGASLPKLQGWWVNQTAVSAETFVPIWEQERSLMKSRLAITLYVTLPVFPCLYLLSYFTVIDQNQLLIGYMVAGFLTKFIFIGLISTEASVLQVAADRRAADSRRNFLKYIFQEVRVPLNMLSMGISVLEQGDSVIEPATVYAFMKSSTENMRSALNEVLLMSKQDDGMRLELKRINIHRLLEKALIIVQKEADSKAVHLILEGFPRRMAINPNVEEPW